ncbi:hypothetical protein BB558_000568 [Smittium angustum]|uniref:J domain-containing protein n=1 Tax=Smittium angustum TaxID=133377 RepID=A0A2U1J121_SMIAN|nr:hypothetical protein BB558_005236 [Smittium angustum]PWA03232.1 hypothetical protein BB558_000568 [Smittium angustum]
MKVGFRLQLILVPIFLFALYAVNAWEEIDYEIFELWDSIKKFDKTTNWYELIGVTEKATIGDINKAYRKISIKYHPDKMRGSKKEIKKATDKFSRIGLVANIFRDDYKRKRYNFFKKNGVPKWRGTGYLYTRYRPGGGSVVVGLLIFFSFIQYLFMKLNYWRAQERIKEYEEYMKAGKKSKLFIDKSMKPNRKSRRNYEEESDEYMDDGEASFNEAGINPYTVEPPRFSNLLVVSIPMYFVKKILSKTGLGSEEQKLELDNESEEYDDTEQVASQKDTKNSGGKKNKKKESINANDLAKKLETQKNAPKSKNTSKENSAAVSDVEFNAIFVEKDKVIAEMSRESSSNLSSSTKKKALKKRNRGPVV